MQYSQSLYTAHKIFRIVQPSALQSDKKVEINIPLYSDKGEAIGKSMDLSVAKFDIRIISGSTLPVNRWAYLDELKQLMQMGIIDDIALLAETDIKDKEAIAKRKSLDSQLQGQVSGAQNTIKDQKGTIETLERQVVQAGIKMKIMQGQMEVFKKKEEAKGKIERELNQVQDSSKSEREKIKRSAESLLQQLSGGVNDNARKLGQAVGDSRKRMIEASEEEGKKLAESKEK